MGIGQELRDVLNEETLTGSSRRRSSGAGTRRTCSPKQRFRTSIVLDGGKIDSVSYGYPRARGCAWCAGTRPVRVLGRDLLQLPLDAARVASSVVDTQSPTHPIDVSLRNPAAALQRS